MKTFLISFLTLLFAIPTVFGQGTIDITLRNTICSYDAHQQSRQYQDAQVVSREDDTGLIPVIERMLHEIDETHRDFVVLSVYNIDNAYATISNGQEIIACDVDFLERVNYMCDTDWGAISIIAHEIGHHYYDHIADPGNPLQQELEADFLSGYILAKLGASLESAQAAMAHFGTERDTHSHPNKYDRVNAIERGWRRAHN